MNVAMIPICGTTMAVTRLGAEREGAPHLIWAHGWGQSGAALLELARSFERLNPSTVIDFPGFGRSKLPPEAWSTADYADAMAEWLRTLATSRRIWIGHSFGCRIGIQIEARHPGLFRGMALIAAAGLPRRRTQWDKIKLNVRTQAFKLAKLLTPEGPARDRLRARFGSVDYRNAGPMRATFVKIATEDLTEVANTISCPTLLLYGRDDHETPPEIGERLEKLISGARLVVLEGYDHNSILVRGQHQVSNEIRKFLSKLT